MSKNEEDFLNYFLSVSEILFPNGYHPNPIFNVTKDNLEKCVSFLENDGFNDEAGLLEELFELNNLVRIHISGDGSPKAMAECIRSMNRERNMSTEDKMLRELRHAYEVVKECHEIAGKYGLSKENWHEYINNPAHQDLRHISSSLDLLELTLSKWSKKLR